MLNVAALAVLFASLAAIGFMLFRRLPRPHAQLKVCAACGFSADQIDAGSFICPGCRSDVRDYGISTPDSAAPHAPLMQAIFVIWVVLFFVFTVTIVLELFVPREKHRQTQFSARPLSHAYPMLTIHAAIRGTEEAIGTGIVTADICRADGSIVTLEVVSPARTCRIFQGVVDEASPPRAFNRAAVADLYRVAGVDTNNPQADNEITAIHDCLCNMTLLSSGALAVGFRITGGSSGGSSGTPMWIFPSAVIAGSAACAAGAGFVIYGATAVSSSRRGRPKA